MARIIELTRELLLPGQEYLIEAQKKYGFEVVEHGQKAHNAAEKARQLGWPRERIIKAVFMGYDKSRTGVISPDYGKVDSARLCGAARPLPIARVLPQGMVQNACGPFVTRAHLEDGLEALFINDTRVEGAVDIALGADERHSVQMPYATMWRILEDAHPEYIGSRIRKVAVPFLSKSFKPSADGVQVHG
jgi:hypothetical protein